jgi:outer membrane protein OmpA-like peptidoglycan-associated protein
MRYSVRLALPLAVFILLSGCAKKTLVVLVPDPDGKTGRVSVTNQAGGIEIESPNQATTMTDREKPPPPPAPVEKETVAALFAEALSIQPKRPAHFLLYFEKDTALTSDSRKLMTDIIAAIRKQASTDISVIGHTDTVGGKDFNYNLSRNRALSIRDMLVEKGVDPASIRTTSHGKENPLIKTEDNVLEPRNRRVEVIIR